MDDKRLLHSNRQILGYYAREEREQKRPMKKFRMETKYVHNRSEGLTRRGNGGTRELDRKYSGWSDGARSALSERSE